MVDRLRHGLATLELESRDRREGLDTWLTGAAFAFDRGGRGAESIVFLGAPEGARLGPRSNPVTVHPEPIRIPDLTSVFTDKDLYREGRDVVRIVVFAPGRGGGKVPVELKLNGQPLSTIEVELEAGESPAGGLGLFEYPEPVAGEWEARAGASSTRFTVAEYKLAPLTARFDGFSVTRGTKPERLRFAALLETYGTPFKGSIGVQLLDLSVIPGAPRQKLSLTADTAGRVEGEVALEGAGPFALALTAKEDPTKTATLPVPGSRAAERSELELSRWGSRRIASLLPFPECEELRGLYAGEDRDHQSTAPLSIVEVDRERVVVRAEARLSAIRLVAFDPATKTFRQRAEGPVEAGRLLELPLSGAWNLLFAGAAYLGHHFEGRAAVLRPVAPPLDLAHPERSIPLSLEVKDRAEPGERVLVSIRGMPRARAFVLVKDERLQVADTPVAATAASLRRQVEAGLALCPEGQVSRTLASVLEPPPPVPPPAFGGRGLMMPMAMPAPGAPAHDPIFMGAAFREKAGAPPSAPTRSTARTEDASRDLARVGPAPAETKVRTEFPEVMLAKLVDLDAGGHAVVPVQLGQAMGSVKVEVFAALGLDWAFAERALLVTREVFGELVLPRFVRAGDPAEGRLYVHVAEGSAKVRVTRDGVPVSLRGEAGDAEQVEVAAPGATLGFGAGPGRWAAEVRGATRVDRSEGKVEEPGKLVWLQKAVRMLSPGESVSLDEPGALALELLPGLDSVFDGMVGGLRGYEHACCEQTSAILLAAAAAYMTAKDLDTRRSAATHVRGCVEREKRMYLRGRGFKGWPGSPDEVFVYSAGATLNLLQLDLLRPHAREPELSRAIDECLEMANDAARAHGIDPAPPAPKSAREAYGRFSRFVDDRQRMAEFIRERVEPWEKELEAILRFDLPGMPTETYHRSSAMIRAETAFGAATLLEAGGEHRRKGLSLANTVLGAIRDTGAMYSTLDSVAAMTLLGALQRSKVVSRAGSKLRVNGEATTLADALERKDLRQVEAVEGPLQVQLTRLVEEDYTAIDAGVRAKVELRRGGRVTAGVVRPGDAIELHVELTSGYEAGDLLHVFLPDCLSWVQGGGQVKRFSLDLAGRASITVPLAVTGATFDADGRPAAQHFAVAIRNMYDEERGKGWGDLAVTVDPEGGGEGLAGKVFRGLKTLLGSR